MFLFECMHDRLISLMATVNTLQEFRKSLMLSVVSERDFRTFHLSIKKFHHHK